ncbi:NIPSNAP family protein [Burkholderia gladioli]|uniref:NIPSNAP family protein n=1 Tax=Burkholderia gladioli TaxID=28095 RepID=UPI000D982824|nr:NIPSNAP family protein [Burkholderia gladioli]
MPTWRTAACAASGSAADPRWQAFVPRLSELIEQAENRILVPTAFSPLQQLPTGQAEPGARPVPPKE